MARRCFTATAALGGVAAHLLLWGCGKSDTPPPQGRLVGLLSSGREDPLLKVALRRDIDLEERGASQGMTFVERYAEFELARLEPLARQLFDQHVAVVFCIDLTAAIAAKTVRDHGRTPIVFVAHDDPVEAGLVDSLAAPGHDIAGLITYRCLDHKLVELLREAVPGIRRIAYVAEFSSYADPCRDRARANAARLGVRLVEIDIVQGRPISHLIADLVRAKVEGAIIPASAPVWQGREEVVAAMAHLHLPAIYEGSVFAESGGLISYGASQTSRSRDTARLLLAVLNGAPAGLMPIAQPDHFELLVNLATARAQGWRLERALLQRADRILE
jgi:putative ABC transport system substrate-binding protein